MKNQVKSVNEPWVRIVKRPTISTSRAMMIRLIAIVCSLLFCSLLSLLLINANPFEFLITMFDGAFSSSRRLWKFAKDAAVLLCISLAVTPAVRMKFWNIGAEGCKNLQEQEDGRSVR